MQRYHSRRQGRAQSERAVRVRRLWTIGAAGALLVVGLLPVEPTPRVAAIVSPILLVLLPAAGWLIRWSIRHADHVITENLRSAVEARGWNAGRMVYLAVQDALEARRMRRAVGADWTIENLERELEASLLRHYVDVARRDDPAIQAAFQDVSAGVWTLVEEGGDQVGDPGWKPFNQALRKALADANEAARRILQLGRAEKTFEYPLLDALRIAGPGLVAVSFLLAWSLVYMAIWGFDTAAFIGLPESPRVGEFIYVAVSATLGGTPEGVEARSPVAQMAVAAELLCAVVAVGAAGRIMQIDAGSRHDQTFVALRSGLGDG
jgi:hypothetical protein